MLRAKFSGPDASWLTAGVVALACLVHMPGAAMGAESWLWGLACASVIVFTLLGFRSVDISVMAPWIYLHLFGAAYFGLYAASVFELAWLSAALIPGTLVLVVLFLLLVKFGPETAEASLLPPPAPFKLFVLAAHAIETPKLLLMSTSRRSSGVANSSGLVGRARAVREGHPG